MVTQLIGETMGGTQMLSSWMFLPDIGGIGMCNKNYHLPAQAGLQIRPNGRSVQRAAAGAQGPHREGFVGLCGWQA